MIHRLTAMVFVCLFPLNAVWVDPLSAADGVTLYRCVAGGRVEFRQTACEKGEESIQQIINGSSGLYPSEPALRLKKPSEKTDTIRSERVRQADEKACWKRRQQLERVERLLRSGYRASQYQRLHERQREYESYLRRFCR